MMKQIQQAIENMGNLNNLEREKLEAILQRFASGEINIEEAYYYLLDGDLISMPQRCGLYAKPERSAQEEESFKNYINTKLLK